MRKSLVATIAMVVASLSLVATAGTAQAQDVVVGTVTSDPASVPAAGEYTLGATGADFIPDTAVLLVACVAPGDTLVPGESTTEEILAAAGRISPLTDCDIAAAQNVEVDGDGAWSAELTADVGDNFFLSAGALDGSQAGAAWRQIISADGGDAEPAEEEAAEEEPAEEEAEEEPAEEEAAEEEPAEEEPADLADTGVETGLLAVVGAAVVGAGVLSVREARRFRH